MKEVSFIQSKSRKLQEKAFASLHSFQKELLDKDKLIDDVFHYTDSLEALSGIIESRRLIMKMRMRLPNDINEEIEDDGEIYHSLFVLRKSPIWYKELKFPSPKSELSNMKKFGDCLEFYIKGLRFFTASLSINRDDNNLWNIGHFCGRERFSIRISKDYFNSAFEEKTDKVVWDRHKPFNGVMKIVYGEKLLSQLSNLISKILIHLEKERTPNEYWKRIEGVFSMLTPLLPKFLDPCFEAENEYRIYTQDIGHTKEHRIAEEIIKKDKNGVLFLYSDEISPVYIKEILIWGAKENFERLAIEVKEILRRNFSEEETRNIKIERSSSFNCKKLNLI